MIVAILVVIGMLASESGPWNWPIKTDHGTTSSFGEYRGERFHMGLDFSTNGVEGEPVRPARPGTVTRVRAGQEGYGRAIYVTHANGWTTVYAHLAAFGPALVEAIRAAGKEPGDYFGTLDLKVAVSSDQIVAYTGESGAGLPHFHFEVRDERNRPLDPLSLDFPKPANLSKTVEVNGVYLMPLNSQSRVNGERVAHFAKPGETVQASGAIGIQVDAYLRGARESRLGVRGLRIRQDGESIGSWLPRRIDFDQYQRAAVVFDQMGSGFGPTHFVYCFDGRADYLASVEDLSEAITCRVDEPTKLTIQVMDQWDAWHDVSLTLSPAASLVAPNPKIELPTQATSLKLMTFQDLVNVQAEGKAGTLGLPTVMKGLAAGERFGFEAPAGEPPIEVTWRAGSAVLKRWVGCLPAKAEFDYRIGPFSLRANEMATIPPQAVILEPADPRIMADVLQYQGPVLRFGREGLPSPTLQIAYFPQTAKLNPGAGLYQWSYQKKKWRFLDKISELNAIGVSVSAFGPLVVAEDISDPRILAPKFHQYFVGKRVVVPISDQGSGVDSETITVHNAAGAVPFEFDRDRGWLILAPDHAGPWTIHLADRSGRSAKVTGLSL